MAVAATALCVDTASLQVQASLCALSATHRHRASAAVESTADLYVNSEMGGGDGGLHSRRHTQPAGSTRDLAWVPAGAAGVAGASSRGAALLRQFASSCKEAG